MNPDKAKPPSQPRKKAISDSKSQSESCTSTETTTNDSSGRKIVDTDSDFTEIRPVSEADLEEKTDYSST